MPPHDSQPSALHAADLALAHTPRPPFAYPLADGRIRVRLRTALGDPRRPHVEWSERFGHRGPDDTAPMRWLCDDATYRTWEADVLPGEGRVRYRFRLEAAGGVPRWFTQAGVTDDPAAPSWPDDYFHIAYTPPARRLDTPGWVRDAICYEIFPERFARGEPPVTPGAGAGWTGEALSRAFWGGDLRGVLQRLDHVSELGANLIWLTPIFRAPSTHKYDTADYGAIDPGFGDDALFANLVAEGRRRGVRILLDGVFNHSGAQFGPWRDVLECGMASPYWGWFDISGKRPDPAARNYSTFAQTPMMPRLMTANPEVQAYLIAAAAKWMRMGIGGWRLDVADEVDLDFWRAFRREMRAIAPDAYLVGEIAYDAARWLEGDAFDGVMNYPLRRAALQYLAAPGDFPGAPAALARIGAGDFLARLGQVRAWYPGWATAAALNALSTHDVPRFRTAVGGDARRYLLGLTFLMTYEGIPQLYYGDEVGMQGGDDPDCRRPMLWDPSQQDADLLAATRRLAGLRRELPALRGSGFRPLATGHPSVAAYLRGVSGTEEQGGASLPSGVVALIALNASEAPATVTVDLAGGTGDLPGALTWPGGSQARDVLAGQSVLVAGGRVQVDVPALGAVVVVPG